jgi:hypothetical protein
MTINAGKSNVVHFRLPSMERSKYIFKCGDMNIELTNNRAIYGNLENKINTLYWPVEDSIPKNNDMFSFKYSRNKVAPTQFCLMAFVHSFLKKWWVESDFKAPNLRFHYGSKVPTVTITVFITTLEQNR